MIYIVQLSNINKATKLAYDKGYRVLDNGSVRGITKFLKLQIRTNKFKQNNKIYQLYKFSIRSDKGKRIEVFVHKLQAYQKFGNAVFQKNIEIRHLDGNSLNNTPENISIGTSSENTLDIDPKIRHKNAINASTQIRKFTDQEMTVIKNFHNGSYKKTMEKFNISSKGTLHYILNTKYQTKVIN